MARVRSLESDLQHTGPNAGALMSLVNAAPWTRDALCAQTDPEAFYPEKGGSTREAKQVCLECPVRFECLEEALDHDERFGIWGGLSERERRKLQRARRARRQHPTTTAPEEQTA